jgi:GT2 family glycosyltransferase
MEGHRDVTALETLFPKAREPRPGAAGAPLVSIIIPNKNAPDLLATCLDGARTQNSYPNLEIIVVDNNSDDPRTEALYREHENKVGFQVVRDGGAFNFSRLINRGVGRASGDYVLLLNNDIEFRNQGWLEEMVDCMAYRQTAIVGPLLLYPDGTIQHAGVIVGLGHGAGHWFVGADPSALPADHRLNFRQNLSAVTGASMLIDRRWFDRVGGFDETAFPVAYNDIDFCLRVRQAGGRIVFTPLARMIHHESVSRGSDETGRNHERWLREFQAFRAKWEIEAFDDFAFSPWFDRMSQMPLIQPWKRPKPYR